MSAEDYWDDRDVFSNDDYYEKPKHVFKTVKVCQILRETEKAYQLRIQVFTFYFPKRYISEIDIKSKRVTLDIGLLKWIINYHLKRINKIIEEAK